MAIKIVFYGKKLVQLRKISMWIRKYNPCDIYKIYIQIKKKHIKKKQNKGL